jgi:hypothetical protein
MGSCFREEKRVHFQKGLPVGFWVLIALGMIILLSSCGSDNTPKGFASVEKQKGTKSGSTTQKAVPFLSPKEGGTALPLPNVTNVPITNSGVGNLDEIEAERAAAARQELSPSTVIAPGLTKGELDAKIEAWKGRKLDPASEILPGQTFEQLDAKRKAHREQAKVSDQILPGLTGEQVKAKLAQNRKMKETGNARLEHVLPPRDSAK